MFLSVSRTNQCLAQTKFAAQFTILCTEHLSYLIGDMHEKLATDVVFIFLCCVHKHFEEFQYIKKNIGLQPVNRSI